MSEKIANVEFAHKLHEKGSHGNSGRTIEIIEALLLAIVAVATAWSGYQSASWDGHSAASFAKSAVLRVDSDEDDTLGEIERMQDISTFNAWLQAKATRHEEMAQLLERRFSDDYANTFKAWLLTDPLNDPNAPTGPEHMPGYKNHLADEGAEKRKLADAALEEGKASREIGEDYVRLTVFLATVLFLIAMSQRFSYRVAIYGLIGVAGVATIIILCLLISYPVA